MANSEIINNIYSMSQCLLSELSEDELAPPEYYPIGYALMWVAHGNRPINTDYAKIIYEKPPKYIFPEYKEAERKLLTYLRSGKISAQSMNYEQDEKGDYYPTGDYNLLDKELWKHNFDWRELTLNFIDDDGQGYEHTHIMVNTKELLECRPINEVGTSKLKTNKSIQAMGDFLPKERESLLKILLGLALTNYEYDPLAVRNSTSSEIFNDLCLHGLSVDEDTIRKWLKEAKKYLPEDWEQHAKPNSVKSKTKSA